MWEFEIFTIPSLESWPKVLEFLPVLFHPGKRFSYRLLAGRLDPLSSFEFHRSIVRTGQEALGQLRNAVRSGSCGLGIAEKFVANLRHPFLDNGDVLLLYTDGLTERRSESGELFDARGAAAALAASAHLNAEEIADAVMAAAAEWGPADDDVTLLVCKRLADSE